MERGAGEAADGRRRRMKLAYENADFMQGEEARSLRILAEYLDPKRPV